ncbi:MAG: hypothetical protein WC565_06545 [Parcubacteria group bacterium]
MNLNLEAGLTRLGSGAERLTCGLLDGLGRVFEHGTTALSRIAIPVADLVVSYAAAQVIAEQTGWAFGWALAAGVAMEGTGVLAAIVPLEQLRFNQERSANEAAAPGWMGWAMFVVQFAFSTVLIVMNAVGPAARLFGWGWLSLHAFGMMTLSVQSLAATVAAALYADLKARERSRTRRLESERREREKAKAERREARQVAKATSVQNAPAPIVERPPRTERQERLVQYVAKHRDASYRDIAQELKIGLGTVSKEVEAIGAHKNGHGWEVA